MPGWWVTSLTADRRERTARTRRENAAREAKRLAKQRASWDAIKAAAARRVAT